METQRFTALLLAVFSIATAQDILAGAAQNPPDKEFAKRVAAYQSIRKKAAKDLPALPDHATPEQIKQRASKLQSRIAKLRAGAKPGDVLTPAVFDLLTAIRGETSGRDGKAAREAVLGDGNPKSEGIAVPLKINAPYPQGAPLSTVPPDMIARMPKLPDGLQYRFTGKNLILYDSEADLVVDFIAQAVH